MKLFSINRAASIHSVNLLFGLFVVIFSLAVKAQTNPYNLAVEILNPYTLPAQIGPDGSFDCPASHWTPWNGQWAADLDVNPSLNGCGRDIYLKARAVKVQGGQMADSVKAKVIYQSYACASAVYSQGGLCQKYEIYALKNGTWYDLGWVLFAHSNSSSFQYAVNKEFNPYNTYVSKEFSAASVTNAPCWPDCHTHVEFFNNSGSSCYNLCSPNTNISPLYRIGVLGGNFSTEAHCSTLGPIDSGVKDSVPANDECAGAFELSPSVPCLTASSVLGATQSLPAINCANYVSLTSNDVWYKFIATSTSHIINTSTSSGLDLVLELRKGPNCNGTYITCADNTSGAGANDTLLANNLSIGESYYIRTYAFTSKTVAQTTNNFDLCIDFPATNNINASNNNVHGIQLFPNPTEGKVDLLFGSLLTSINIEITDLIGKTVLKQSFYPSHNIQMDISEFKKGIYFVQINSIEQQATIKLVKK